MIEPVEVMRGQPSCSQPFYWSGVRETGSGRGWAALGAFRLRALSVGVAVDDALRVSRIMRVAVRARAPTRPAGEKSTTPLKSPPRKSSHRSGELVVSHDCTP